MGYAHESATVAHDVVFAFHGQLDQVVPARDFGLDEAALEVGVDHVRAGLGRSIRSCEACLQALRTQVKRHRVTTAEASADDPLGTDRAASAGACP